MNGLDKRSDWSKFVKTGQVSDYLRYRQANDTERVNPRRRISDSSVHKKFY